MPTKKAAPSTRRRPVASKKPVLPVKKIMIYATDAESFWLTDGGILNSLESLKDALATMSAIVFAHHVTKEKNDFADWVAVVLRDSECAQDLRQAKTLTAARRVVAAHLRRYDHA
jgi:hypothetical protein